MTMTISPKTAAPERSDPGAAGTPPVGDSGQAQPSGESADEAQKKGKSYSDQPVYVCSYRLLKELTVCYSRIPRDLRYTLGSRMLEAMTDVSVNVAWAFKTPKGKSPYIKQAARRMDEVKICLRLLRDLNAVSAKFFLHTVPLSSDVSSQLASWYHFTRRKECGAAGGTARRGEENRGREEASPARGVESQAREV